MKSSVVRLLFPADDETVTQTFDAQSGAQLGHFAIIERIRTGGMGAVFRALDTRLSRVVALKVLPPTLSRDAPIVQRFKNEAQAAAQLDHENVARVYFIGEEHGLHFIAFEFVNGTNIRDLISQQTRLPVAEAVNYVLQIASALVHTSAQGVVHRDIKPSNIIITSSGRAKLVDLGLARKENKDDQAADLTVAGTTLGTFDYISPEQARDPRVADVRSDIYSLGCTLYHMLTGEPPYPEGTVLQKLLQHQGDEAPDPAIKNRLVPENLSIVVRKMMAKDPRRRYQNAEQLVRDLVLVAGAMGLRSISPEGLVWLSSQPDRGSFWERHLAWMVTAAILLVIVGYMEFTGGPASPARDAGSVAAVRPWEGRGKDGSSAVGNPRADDAADRRDTRPAPSNQGNSGRDTKRGGSDENDAPDAATGSDEEVPSRDAEGSDLIAGESPIVPGTGNETQSEDPENDADESPTVVAPIPRSNGLRGTVEGSVSLGTQIEPAVATFGPAVAKSGAGVASPADRGSSITGQPKASAAGESASNGDAEDPPARPAQARRTDTESPPPAAEEEGYFLLGRGGAADARFTSLETACSQVRTDGTVIELRFNGRRRESGIRINRKINIRAARGFRPVLEFRPTQSVSEDYKVRAVWIPSGALDLIGVDVVLSVDESVVADQWSLFSLERADSLRMEGVTVTLVNPAQRPVAVVELSPGAGALMPDMPVAGAPPKRPLEVEISDSILRGDGDLFAVRHSEPARLTITQSIAALRGTLLSVRGVSESTQENAQLELRLEHVTCALSAGLIRLERGNMARKLLPVQISASNNIFTNPAGTPLIAMTGNLSVQDFRSLLFWVGQNNFYDRFQTLWSIDSTEGSGQTWDASDWRKYWTDASSEANPQFEPVVWSKRRWLTRPLSELTADDFSLDKQAVRNAAVGGATNSTDAGADLSRLPRPAPTPVAGDEPSRD